MAKNYFAPMHTAEHILNQTMVRKFGCDRSFSNHIEKKKSKCDYHFSRNLVESEITSITSIVNEEISKNHDVTEEYINIDVAEKIFNLSRLPESTGNSVRIIKIGDYDSCPCIGEHVNNTSIIGEFKIISTSFDDGILRIRFRLSDIL
ncbi:MAG: hypothetical protein CVV23_04935 [Ignavibacteriae bacterium HGW-Ignavibacteriae-2]|jgi:Ser-tRNA(Ala) deacylase AlaX|nr:MAG: hypothetical protein CVV23_04935 [Ignavibacteriae bacterium HGW-Ignavibacteriae-2]